MKSIAKKTFFVIVVLEIPIFLSVKKKCSSKFGYLGGPLSFDDLYLEIYIIACHFHRKNFAKVTFPPLYL